MAKETSWGEVTAVGYSTIISATLTRPANTNAYTDGDEVTDVGGAILTFEDAARLPDFSGVIIGASLDFSSNWGTKPESVELWLFHTSSTPQADNAAFAPSDGVLATRVAIIPIATVYQGDPAAGTGNFVMEADIRPKSFVTSGSANLFGRLVLRGAGQAGANSDTIKVNLEILQD